MIGGRFLQTFLPLKLVQPCRCFVTSRCAYLFWEPDIKSGYNKDRKKYTKTELIREGLKELKHEIRLWKEEVVEKIESDPLLFFKPGVVDKQWEFNTPEALSRWIVTADSDHNEGNSTASLILGRQNAAVFSGVLDTTPPKDGTIKRAGYAAIRSSRARKSFKRNSYINWSQYSHLVMRVRGDGRSYLLTISTCGYWDQLWNDAFHYVLFTRGGPYWQIAKIPFSKFFFSSKGRIQDLQSKVPLDKVTHFGITSSDKINGPFSLEIDYIGVEFDPSHTEEFAHEMYRLPKNIAAT